MLQNIKAKFSGSNEIQEYSYESLWSETEEWKMRENGVDREIFERELKGRIARKLSICAIQKNCKYDNDNDNNSDND